ncbi:hypothetical protein [Persicirhabdus sediminis]|uniref:Lipoprotein n=1 Tax=Persicirhabdus sediminis TaxID=454144 RepID=A0A8J7MB19_9BACT|nr:hypothetical protein [Persicirhabdus sediminis]MBK1789696.1 hypothetical protein [Persicirhabdus sediminis]
MKKNTLCQLVTAVGVACSLVSCSTMTAKKYEESQFVGSWNYEQPGFHIIPPISARVENRSDGTSKTVITKVGQAPAKSSSSKMKKLKAGTVLMENEWSISGSTFVEKSESGKTFRYQILSVSPDQYVLRNGMGDKKVYDRIK